MEFARLDNNQPPSNHQRCKISALVAQWRGYSVRDGKVWPLRRPVYPLNAITPKLDANRPPSNIYDIILRHGHADIATSLLPAVRTGTYGSQSRVEGCSHQPTSHRNSGYLLTTLLLRSCLAFAVIPDSGGLRWSVDLFQSPWPRAMIHGYNTGEHGKDTCCS